MSYSIIPTDKFKKQFKQLLKKYRSLITDIWEFETIISENPEIETLIFPNTF